MTQINSFPELSLTQWHVPGFPPFSLSAKLTFQQVTRPAGARGSLVSARQARLLQTTRPPGMPRHAPS